MRCRRAKASVYGSLCLDTNLDRPAISGPVRQASGWIMTSARIITTRIRIPVLSCPYAQRRLPEPDRDQTRRQVHKAVTARSRRQGCRASARCGWHALITAATARHGTNPETSGQLRSRYAPPLSRSRRPRARTPSGPQTGGHRRPAVLRRHGGRAPDRCGQPAQDRQPRSPRTTLVTGAYQGQCR
jgi:hypothetical protein